LAHQSFKYRGIGSLDDMRSGILHGKLPGNDLDRPSVVTHGGDRGVGSWGISIPVDRRLGKSTLKTPTQIWTVHLREDACHAILHFGDPGTRHRDVGIREIGVPEVVEVGTSEVSKT
jgi:hypothetical protein